ncbi:hypothetical protein P875_00086692 [Aspergillus parasiticus SU-1]|uniref:Zn(2)-C6 fungal-type domain-containing protein n=1 Tax=Aspergillus parasiticus (strain ATCC 56775 / NRRL 5862 / SRRC 143 / SU-1) TaxID=1403190 RepID=A0A0F0I6Z3_ASPPU|nr:hypothetical protein P875_00086692 [Aspergillus parasiticus SU-1]
MYYILLLIALYLSALPTGEGAGLFTPKKPNPMSSEWRKQCQDIKIVEDFKHNLRTNPHRGFPKQHLLAWCNFVGPNGQTRLRQTSIPLDKCIGWNSDGFAGSNPRFIADGNGPTKGQCWNCVYQYWVREGQPNLGCWCKSAPPPKLVYEEESGDMGVQKFFNLERRIKCDEARPHCLKCSSTGRKCDGYETPSPPPPQRNVGLRLPYVYPQTLQCSGNTRETRSFQFFYERTVPSLAGLCGSEFWSGLVLRVSQHETAVYHALIALGSLHENFENGHWLTRRGIDTFAVQQYVSAIRALLGSSDSSPCVSPGQPAGSPRSLTLDVCLISCILFIFIEIMSGHYESAVGHVRSGIRILQDVYEDPQSGTYHHPYLKPSTVTNLEMDYLRKILNRLQDQALTLTRTATDLALRDGLQVVGSRHAEIPECFPSILDAYECFEYHVARLYQEYSAIEPIKADMALDEYTNLMQQAGALMDKWSTALHRFEESRGSRLTYRDSIGLKILRIYQYWRLVILDRGKSEVTDLQSWDKYNSTFQLIVSLAEAVINTADSDAPLSSNSSALSGTFENRRPSFSLDMGIICPLYDVATLCRDPSIRRQAVKVLRSASRQEGLLNSHLCAIVAEQVIELEETAALRGGIDDQKCFASVATHPLGPKPSSQAEASSQHITRSSEVPHAARFIYAYPIFDPLYKQAFLTLTVDQVGERHTKIPLPAMTAMLDME